MEKNVNPEKKESGIMGCESSSNPNGKINTRVKLEEIVIKSLIGLLSFEGSLDHKIEKILQYLGEFSQTDRSYIFLFSNDGYIINNTHEWVAKNIGSEKENLQNLPCKTFPWFIPKIKNKEIINIPNVEEMPESAAVEKEIFQAQAIQSLVVVPLVVNEKAIGFLGFDAVKHLREWQIEDISLLQAIGNVIGKALERRQYDKELHKRELNYRILFENSNDGIFLLDLEGNHMKVNQMAAKMLGYTQEELEGLSYKNLVALEEIGISEQTLTKLIQGDTPPPYEKTMMTKNRRRLPVEINLALIKDEKGQPLIIQSIVRDLSSRNITQKEIKRLTFFKNSVFQILNETLSHDKAILPIRTLLELNLKVIDSCDHGWVFELFQDQLIPIMEKGPLKEDLTIEMIKTMSQRLNLVDDVTTLKADEIFQDLKPEFIEEDIHFLIIPIKNNNKNTIVFVLKQAEVESKFGINDLETSLFLKKNFETMLQRINLESSLLKKQRQLTQLADIDSLTGLFNRRKFGELVTEYLKKGTHSALLYVDLNKFKEINDTLGHNAGDKMLSEITSRIKRVSKGKIIAGRLGGDEFGLLLPVTDKGEINRTSAMILNIIEADYDIPGWYGRISASIGIAMYPNDGNTFEELLKNADIAMYEAKSSKHDYVFFNQELAEKIENNIEMEKEIEISLRDNDFILYYQPILKTKDEQIKGYEALVRWNHKERGILSPFHFLPFAEKTGLIAKIDEKIREIAVLKLEEWAKQKQNFALSINVSAKEFLKPGFLDNMERLFDTHKIDLRKLIIEITENSFLEDYETTVRTINYLKERGIQFSIDDFGTGYSSLSYLRKIPVDYLKIDMEFIKDIHHNRVNRTIVESTIKMAHDLGFKTVCEGVEAREEFNVLKQLQTDYVQGYLFGKPAPL